MKRKRTAETAATSAETPADPGSTSESDASEQDDAIQLDSFQEDLAKPIEALNEAVANTAAFLKPSEQLSSLARAAAKVCFMQSDVLQNLLLLSIQCNLALFCIVMHTPLSTSCMPLLLELHLGHQDSALWLEGPLYFADVLACLLVYTVNSKKVPGRFTTQAA